MQLWTYEHFITLIPTVAVMIVIALILNKFIGNKPWSIRSIPLKVVAVLLFLSEVGKQVLSFKQGYNLYHIPLHVCSLFISLLPVMAFYTGKYCDRVRAIACSMCTSLMLFMTVYPNLIYSPGNIRDFFEDYFDFHTVFFHNAVIFAFILIVVLRLNNIEDGKSYTKSVIRYGTIYALLASSMAQILKENYSNFYKCNVGPINDLLISLKESIGYVPVQIAYVVVLFGLHIGFFVLSYLLYRAIDRLNVKLRGAAEQ